MLGIIVSVKYIVEFEDLRDFIPYLVGMVYFGKYIMLQSIREEGYLLKFFSLTYYRTFICRTVFFRLRLS